MSQTRDADLSVEALELRVLLSTAVVSDKALRITGDNGRPNTIIVSEDLKREHIVVLINGGAPLSFREDNKDHKINTIVVNGGDQDDLIQVEGARGRKFIHHTDLLGNAGDDTLIGGASRDKIFGGDGNDVIRGGGGADSHVGGIGDNTIIGDAGLDLIYG